MQLEHPADIFTSVARNGATRGMGAQVIPVWVRIQAVPLEAKGLLVIWGDDLRWLDNAPWLCGLCGREGAEASWERQIEAEGCCGKITLRMLICFGCGGHELFEREPKLYDEAWEWRYGGAAVSIPQGALPGRPSRAG